MSPKQEIQNRVRQHRLLAGMTQQELADRIEVTRQTVLSIERGRYNPSVGLALSMAEVFGVAVEDLFQIDRGESDA